ncbi:acylneuraminate cytidylyltransferase family protein [Flavobacteriaceae bacterium]|nr:acylneuraminate cytidylyltransferase family protein [Flavobacteriaceae bacterium]
MKVISIITARGGSKGIPGKNIIDINGFPLIYYSIRASLDSNVSETWVSTDCEKIAAIAKSYPGVFISNRPKHLANDIVHAEEALIQFSEDYDYDLLVFIQPTSPMIKPEYINAGISMMKSGKYDSVFSVTEEHWIPRWDKDVNPIKWSIDKRPRRQDKDPTYVENGMFYITSRSALLKNKLRYGGKMGFVKIPLKNSFQIDSLEDLDLIKKII